MLFCFLSVEFLEFHLVIFFSYLCQFFVQYITKKYICIEFYFPTFKIKIVKILK
jgi:hypothetical protein